MKDLLDFIIKYVAEGNVLILLVGVIVGIAFNLNKIFVFLDERKKIKLANIKEAIGSDCVDEKTKQFLKEELALEHFRLVKGFGLEKNLRTAAIDVVEKSKGALNFIHFKRGLYHLHMIDGQLTVKVSVWDKIVFIYNTISSVILALVAVVFFILPKFIEDLNFYRALGYFGTALLFFMMSAFFVLQLRPVLSAGFIKEELDKQANTEKEEI